MENDKDFLADDQSTISKYEIQQAQKQDRIISSQRDDALEINDANRNHETRTTWYENIFTRVAQDEN